MPTYSIEFQARHSLLQRLHQHWQGLARLFEQVVDPALLLDTEGRILFLTGPLAMRLVEELQGSSLLEFVPTEHRQPVDLALRDAVSPGLAHTLDLPILEARTVRWYQASLSPVREESRVVAVLVLTTEVTRRRQEEERLRRSERLMVDTQGVAHLGTWEWDPTEVHATWSAELYRIYGLDPATHVPSYQDYLQRVHPEDREQVMKATERVFSERMPYSHDERILRGDGELRYLHTWAEPFFDAQGQLLRLIGVCQDITDQKVAELERARSLEREQAARTQAEQAERRSSFIAEVSRILTSSLETRDTIDQVVRLVVPRFADLCGAVLGEEQEGYRMVIAHREPALEARLRQLFEGRSFDISACGGPAKVIRTGHPELFTEVLPSFLGMLGLPRELSDALGEGQQPGSYFCAPLLARGRVCGALCVARAAVETPFSAQEFMLFEEVARRMVSAMENERLFREARRAIQVREEFLSVAAHELRTPLTTLQIQLSSYQRGDQGLSQLSSERMQKLLESMRRQVSRLTLLVSNLLDVSRLAAGRLALLPEQSDLLGLVREVIGRFQHDIERASCTLRLHAAGPVMGCWDGFHLEQVISNLLSNALKYGAGKPIDIFVTRDATTATLRVRDQGIGIAPEDAKRIFQPFERAVSIRHYGGLGLGLYITRNIVEAHGGTIEVSSKPGQGSCFQVQLPLAPEF